MLFAFINSNSQTPIKNDVYEVLTVKYKGHDEVINHNFLTKEVKLINQKK